MPLELHQPSHYLKAFLECDFEDQREYDAFMLRWHPGVQERIKELTEQEAAGMRRTARTTVEQEALKEAKKWTQADVGNSAGRLYRKWRMCLPIARIPRTHTEQVTGVAEVRPGYSVGPSADCHLVITHQQAVLRGLLQQLTQKIDDKPWNESLMSYALAEFSGWVSGDSLRLVIEQTPRGSLAYRVSFDTAEFASEHDPGGLTTRAWAEVFRDNVMDPTASEIASQKEVADAEMIAVRIHRREKREFRRRVVESMNEGTSAEKLSETIEHEVGLKAPPSTIKGWKREAQRPST